MNDYRELNIGCGEARSKWLTFQEDPDWVNVLHLDMYPECNPDIVWDLNKFPYPFGDNSFNEIHAYNVLEHIGQQGDYVTFFNQFKEFWRILKPDGLFCGCVPKLESRYIWADPSHSRVIQRETFWFLDQEVYNEKVPAHDMTDFRHIYKEDFEFVYENIDYKPDVYYFALKCHKPSRYKE